MKMQNLLIDKQNEQARFDGRKVKGKVCRWDTPKFMVNFVDYFGIELSLNKEVK